MVTPTIVGLVTVAHLWGWPLLLKFQRLQNPEAWNRNDTKAARRCHVKTNEPREPGLVWHICALLVSKHETEKGTIWRNWGKVERFPTQQWRGRRPRCGRKMHLHPATRPSLVRRVNARPHLNKGPEKLMT